MTGRYFADCNEAAPQQPGVRSGVAAYAINPDKARLWQVSKDMLSRQSIPSGTNMTNAAIATDRA